MNWTHSYSMQLECKVVKKVVVIPEYNAYRTSNVNMLFYSTARTTTFLTISSLSGVQENLFVHAVECEIRTKNKNT